MALPCNNLNLNLYRIFYVVAKTKSFSESSKVLHISQPAISKHVQNLEYELNTTLFYRNNRGIELTPEAKSLLEYVEKAYNFLMLGEKQLQESKDLMKGQISLGTRTSISNYLVNDKIKQFMKEHHNIVLRIVDLKPEKLIELIHQHNLDLLILPNHYEIPKDLKKTIIDKESFCFAYNPEKMGKLNITTLEELNNYPLLMPSRHSTRYKKINALFNDKGLNVNPIMELENTEITLNYIKEGMGIGYIPEKVVTSDSKLSKVELDCELPSEVLILIYNENALTNSSKEFIKILTNNE